YLKSLDQDDLTPEQRQEILDDLHKSFASLSQEEQKYANIFLNDVRSCNVRLQADKTFKDYIIDYLHRGKREQVRQLVEAIGVDANKLQELMNLDVNDQNINDFGRFDALKATVDKERAKAYFEAKEGTTIPPFRVNIRVEKLLKDFIKNDGMDINVQSDSDIPAVVERSEEAKALVAAEEDQYTAFEPVEAQAQASNNSDVSFEVLKNDPDTLYLPIKQIYFDAIVKGSKKAEYREIKSTTAHKYLLREGSGNFVVNKM